jgi:hypothetical protein
VGSSDEETDVGSKRKRRYESDESGDSSDSSSSRDDSSSESSDEEHKRKRHKKEKKSKKDKKHKKLKKEKKDKKSKKDKSHHSSSRSSHESSTKNTRGVVNQNEYGKYGLIRESDLYKKQREFEAYMAEVRNVPGVMMLSKREVADHFRTFAEDFNTATMPHEKYYNYEQWEMGEYQRNQDNIRRQRQQAYEAGNDPQVFNDEEIRRLERKREKAVLEQREFQLLRQQMLVDSSKRSDMKKQAELRTELQQAHRRGDVATVKRLERLLAPDEQGPAVKHPWSS